MKKIIIIGTYPSTTYTEQLLSECIDKASQSEYDIMLVSHYPLPDYIQKKVDYYIFDKENTLEPYDLTPLWEFYNDSFEVSIKGKGHVTVICRNMFNGIGLAKHLGYDFFYFMESDNLFDSEDILKLEILRESMFDNNKSMILFCQENQEVNIYESLIFGGTPSYFLNNMSFPLTIDEYRKAEMSPTLERTFHDKLSKRENNLLLINELSSVYFNKSSLNIISNNFKAEVIYNASHDVYIFWINNATANPYTITLKSNIIEDIELPPNGWYYLPLQIGTKFDIEVIENGIITKKEFDISEDNLSKYKEIGIITFK
jgi:hypothetical protein